MCSADIEKSFQTHFFPFKCSLVCCVVLEFEGEIGAAGDQGFQGTTGLAGLDGIDGAKGEQGDRGQKVCVLA